MTLRDRVEGKHVRIVVIFALVGLIVAIGATTFVASEEEQYRADIRQAFSSGNMLTYPREVR